MRIKYFSFLWLIVIIFSLLNTSILNLAGYGSSMSLERTAFYQTGDLVNKDKPVLAEKSKAKVQEMYGKLPLFFIQNNGQMDEKILFYEKGSGHSMFFTKRGVSLSLVSSYETEDRSQNQVGLRGEDRCMIPGLRNVKDSPTPTTKNGNQKSEIIQLVPLGGSKSPEIIAEGIQQGKINYFVGNNAKKWKANIPTYQTVVYKEIYKNIDMKFYGNNRHLEYDIIVKSGANPNRVQLAYQGIKGLKVTEDGNLEIMLKNGNLFQKKLYIYQEIDGKKVEIEGRFRVQNSKHFIYGFQVASYNTRYPLIIDPVLDYSTYLGGSGNDWGRGIAVDNSGNIYVTGVTDSNSFPLASPLYDSNSGLEDIFVSKISADGSTLIYSTYLGGSDWDSSSSIKVDSSGNAYVTGDTIVTALINITY